MVGSRDRYGPQTHAIEAFLDRLGILDADAWRRFLPDQLLFGNRATVGSFRIGAGMPRTWEEACREAHRVAEPDRDSDWMRAVEAAGERLADPILRGAIRWTSDRAADDYPQWVASLPGREDPHWQVWAQQGLPPAVAFGRARDLWAMSESQVAAEAALNMTWVAVGALVVRDRLEPDYFRLLYSPFRELVELSMIAADI